MKEFFKKAWSWILKNKVVSIIVSSVLVVGITCAIVLPIALNKDKGGNPLENIPTTPPAHTENIPTTPPAHTENIPTTPPAHSHTYTHGLCDCGDYIGSTLKKENGTQITFAEIKAGATVYGRYEVSEILHYYYSCGLQIAKENREVKFYARYTNGISGEVEFREISIPAGTDYTLGKYFEVLPVDGYVYMDFTNKSVEDVTHFGFAIYTSEHSHSESFAISGSEAIIDLDEAFVGGNQYCYKYSATAGRYLIYTKSDFVQFPQIYGTENALLNGELDQEGGNFYLTLTEDQDLYFHFFCNQTEEKKDSHFTIQNVT